MPQKILAPLDGSSLSKAVLPHIVAFTRINGNEVTLLRILENNRTRLPQLDPVDWHLAKIQATTDLEETAAQLRTHDLILRTEVLEGPAAERIIEYAHKHEYDLIALSTHGESGLSGWTVSSVAQKVIERSHKSILLTPAYHASAVSAQVGEVAGERYRRILVPLDGSPRAEWVLAKASALARYHEAELILVHVVTPPHLMQRMPLTDEDQALIRSVVMRNRHEAEHYFDQLRTRWSPMPTTHVLEGEHVAVALHEFVAQAQIDLVILSAHGDVYEDKRPYGNLAASLMTYGAVPVLVFQDLADHEIEPTPAELALHTSEFNSQKRLNSPQLTAA